MVSWLSVEGKLVCRRGEESVNLCGKGEPVKGGCLSFAVA